MDECVYPSYAATELSSLSTSTGWSAEIWHQGEMITRTLISHSNWWICSLQNWLTLEVLLDRHPASAPYIVKLAAKFQRFLASTKRPLWPQGSERGSNGVGLWFRGFASQRFPPDCEKAIRFRRSWRVKKRRYLWPPESFGVGKLNKQACWL